MQNNYEFWAEYLKKIRKEILLLCKNKDRLTAKWALKSTNVPIGISSFELNKYIPNDVVEKLPTEEDLNLNTGEKYMTVVGLLNAKEEDYLHIDINE